MENENTSHGGRREGAGRKSKSKPMLLHIDNDMVEWLDKSKNKSRVVNTALRRYRNVQSDLTNLNFNKMDFEQRFYEEDFISYLKSILKEQSLEAREAGITQLTIDKGYDALSTNQKHILKKHVIQPNYIAECATCSSPIPWCEMLYVIDNKSETGHAKCTWCQRMEENDN